MDPHITCNSYDDCRAVTGGCIWWYCTVNIMKGCTTTDDCGDSGGICTGPGHCKAFPEAACRNDRECEPFGGACIVGGYCLKKPDFSCLDDIDCDPDDRCSFHEPRWWRANDDFPQDRDFGPYPNAKAKPGSASNSYRRVDGPAVWIEFLVKSEDGTAATNVYYNSIWRDKLADYGGQF